MLDIARLAQESRDALLRAGGQASAVFGFPIDIELLLIRCHGDTSFAAGLISRFRDTEARAITELRSNVSNQDYHAVIESVRAIAGTAIMLEAQDLRLLATNLEAAAESRDHSQLVQLVHEMGNEIQRCLGFATVLLEVLEEFNHAG